MVSVCNALEANLHFTVEEEVDRSLPFLYGCVKVANDGTIVTPVYGKPMSALRLLPFKSNHHYSVKTGIVQGLLTRAFNISSNEQVLNDELLVIRTLLREGGYPNSLFDRILKKVNVRLSGSTDVMLPKIDLVKWGVTFHPSVFDVLNRNFKKLGVELVASNMTKLKNCFPNEKEKTDPLNKKGVVYQLSCAHCPATYIGQTGQCLRSRLYRHKLGERNLDFEHYPLVEHVVTKEHAMKWDDVKILRMEANLTKRCLWESLFISRDANAVNRQQGMVHSDIFNGY